MNDVLEMTPEAAREHLAAATLRGDIVAFARHLGFEPALHHELMLREAQGALDGRTAVLLIAAPPGSAKSTYMSVLLPLFQLARNPRADVLILGAAQHLAARFSRRVRNLLQDPRFVAAAKANVGLSDDSQAADDFTTAAGGSCRAFGSGANILGNRADLIVLDDVVPSFEVAASETQLLKMHEWLQADVISRLKPTGVVVCVQQRLAYNDAFGFLSRYFERAPSIVVRQLVLRAEAEADDPLGRQPGEVLWSSWYTPDAIARAKLSALRWATMYQQRPMVSTGEWVPADALVIDEQPPRMADMSVYGMSDFATGSGLAGDFTVHAIVGVALGADRLKHLHILDIWRQRAGTPVAVDYMLHLAKRYGVRHWLCDADMIAKSLHGFIVEKARATGHDFRFELISLGGKNKEERASPLRAMLWERRVHAQNKPWLAPLREEFAGFPVVTGSGVDDQIDALGLLPRFIDKANAPGGDAPQRPQFDYTLPDGTVIRREKLISQFERYRGGGVSGRLE